MNVTDRGYYTSTYLDNVNNKRSTRNNAPRRDENQRLTRQISDYSLSNKETGPILSSNQSHAPSRFPTQLMGESTYREMQEFMPESPESNMTQNTMQTDPINYDPDELIEGITPAQLNYLQKAYDKKKSKRRSDYNSYYDKPRNAKGRRSVAYDYEDQESDITAEDSNSSRYENYYSNDHEIRIPKDSSKLKPTPKFKQSPQKGFHGYYINQKKRYDNAEFVKPTNYTHKTFKDIFQDDETTGKYNPIELVFDDPEKIREQEQKQKVKKAFKTIQVKLGKDDYDNYDYYNNQVPKKNNVANEIFVTGGEGSDDDSEYEKIQDITGTGEDGEEDDGIDGIYKNSEPKKKKVNFKKLWKSKTKQIKKELGKDYFNSMEKQWVIEAEKKERREKEKDKKLQDKELKMMGSPEMEEYESENEGPIITEPDDEASKKFYAGQNPDFHPAWNYLLSWITYDQSAAMPRSSHPSHPSQPKSITSQSIAEIETIPEEVTTIVPSTKHTTIQRPKSKSKAKNNKRIKVTKEQLKSFNKNVVKMKNMWSLPASNLFNGQVPNSPVISKRTVGKNTGATIDEPLPQSLFDFPMDGDSQEFVVELDSDEDIEGIDQELYFNPNTGQLEPEPPTSFSAMDHAPVGTPNFFQSKKLGTPNSNTGNFYIDTSNGASTIISNINSLIKSIKVIKIIFAPIDIIAENFPHLQTVVILVELVIFMWLLYELSLLIDALCMMVKAVCAPMIAMGRFMNRIM